MPAGFNEAAGRTPRMPSRITSPREGRDASMRPRGVPRGCLVQPADDLPVRRPASMRPRGVPRGCLALGVGPGLIDAIHASMRPRGVPRGCLDTTWRIRHNSNHASMRPRGVPRGCRLRRVEPLRNVDASMRPRGVPRGCRTARKSLRASGLPWHLRAVDRMLRRERRRSVDTGRGHGRQLSSYQGSAGSASPVRGRGGTGALDPWRRVVRHTMTGSRRTAWNVLPRLTTRGSMPSATPTSTKTTWSSA